MRMQRQPKRVMVPCVNTTVLQCWSRWHPTMLSIPLTVSTTPQPRPCLVHPLLYGKHSCHMPDTSVSSPMWENADMLRVAPCTPQLSLRGIPLWQQSFERLFTDLHPAWTRKACSIKSWHWGFVGVPIPRAWELPAPGCPQHLPTDRHFSSSKMNWEVFTEWRVKSSELCRRAKFSAIKPGMPGARGR